MTTGPTERTRELDRLLARIKDAGMIQLNYDMWDRWGSTHATPEERATWEADVDAATADQNAAKAELAALVAATREAAPSEIVVWAAAHEAYLTELIAELIAKGEGDSTSVFVAKQELAAWGEVRAGTRAFVDENGYYVTRNDERYRRRFGIDPRTRERVD